MQWHTELFCLTSGYPITSNKGFLFLNFQKSYTFMYAHIFLKIEIELEKIHAVNKKAVIK